MANKFNLSEADFVLEEKKKDVSVKENEKKTTVSKNNTSVEAPVRPQEPQKAKKRGNPAKMKMDGSTAPLTRLNMVITQENHDYIMTEGKIRNITAAKLVNQIIDEYKKSAKGYLDRATHEQLRELLGKL